MSNTEKQGPDYWDMESAFDKMHKADGFNPPPEAL